MSTDPRWSEAGLLRELDQCLPEIALGPHVNLAHFLHHLREQLRSSTGEMVTTFAAREFVMRERWSKEGCRCPVCDQNAKVWKRSLTTEMGYSLVNVIRKWKHDQRWILSSELRGLRGGDYAKLRYWNLVVFENEPEDDEKRASGGMQPTERGIAFARRRLSVQRSALVYNGKPLVWEGELVSIDQLPDFNYDEIWGTDLEAP